MCGRYRLSRRKEIIEEHFDTAPWEEDWNPPFNIAPTQLVPVIRQQIEISDSPRSEGHRLPYASG